MDSGMSGSLQSSSGGDDEYDSRAVSISALLAQPQHVVVDCISHHPQPPPQLPQSTVKPNMYNPLSTFFEQPLPPLPGDHNSSAVRNLDAMWSKTLRSDPTSAPMINPMLASSSSSSPNSQPLSQQRVTGGFTTQSAPVSFPLAAEQHISGTGATTAAGGTSDQTHVVRNPKKRSRASRRAPTTVLTTDTTNFRAMVQEFTGIPAPPFTSLPFSRTCLDTFGAPSAMRSAAASHFDNIRQSPSYLRRPFAQKIQPLQPTFLPPASSSFLPSTLVDVLASSSTNNINNISSGSSVSPSKYQLISQSPNLLGISSNTSQLKMGGFLDEFGTANAGLGGLPSLISPSEASAAMSRRSENTPASWDGGGLRSKLNDHDQGQGQSQPQSSNNIFSCNPPTANGKPNLPATSSNFHGYKVPENAGGSRGEGMVESWICSSE